jgi:hypothetical protein
MLLQTAAIFLIREPLVGQIVEPLLFGSQTRLSPVVVLGTTFWTLLWGPVGVILAVPLTLAVVVMGQHIPRLEFLRILLGNEPALQPHEQVYHQLLAGEAIQAAKDADRWIGERTFENHLDDVAISSRRAISRPPADERAQRDNHRIHPARKGDPRFQARAAGGSDCRKARRHSSLRDRARPCRARKR